MYRLYDFHVGKKKHREMAHPMFDDEDEPADQIDEERHLIVYVNDDQIVLDRATLNQPNNDGWTPLHACCHTPNTAKAGKKILELLCETDESLEKTTKRGPGSFSVGWTALQIACM